MKLSIKRFLKLAAIFAVFAIILKSSAFAGEGFMWKAESPTATAYLLGSIHIADKSVYPLADHITKAYESSDALVVEVNANEINPMEMMQLITITDGTTLKDAVGEDTYKELEAVFKKQEMPEMSYIRMKPAFAIMTAFAIKLAEEADVRQQDGIDFHFMQKAAGDNKPIDQLETMEFQINSLNRAFDSQPKEFYEYTKKTMDLSKDAIMKMLKYWKEGDVEGFGKFYFQSLAEMKDFPEISEILIDERNVTMTEKIEELMKTDKTYFIVVGSGHLVGDNGIVNRLKKSGEYKVKRIKD